jgi:hypothetical protein
MVVAKRGRKDPEQPKKLLGDRLLEYGEILLKVNRRRVRGRSGGSSSRKHSSSRAAGSGMSSGITPTFPSRQPTKENLLPLDRSGERSWVIRPRSSNAKAVCRCSSRSSSSGVAFAIGGSVPERRDG